MNERKNKEINYYLALELLPGDYCTININELGISLNMVVDTLESIDSFTCRHTESDIKDAIEKGNIVQAKYLAGKLKIISNVGHSLPCLYKDDYENVVKFQMNNDILLDSDLRNKIFNKYNSIINKCLSDKDLIHIMGVKFNNALKANDKNNIFEMIEWLPYNKVRDIYILISEEIKNKKIENRKILELEN